MFFDTLTLSPLSRLEKKRQQALNLGKVPPAAAAFYENPVPLATAKLSDLSFTALDFETSGLDLNQDSILSFGGVNLSGDQIDFSSGFHHYLKVGDKIKKDSAVINQITPEQLSSGLDSDEARALLIQKLAGRIVICHGAMIERSFLLKMLGLKPNFTLPLIFLDTLKIERSLMHRQFKVDDLRLCTIRARRNLPPYVCHNALADSVACAEVFLAQVKDVFGKTRPTLGQLYKRSL